MTNPPKNNWNAQQISLSKKWGTLRVQNASKKSTVPRASWPEENTEVLQGIESAQRKYYEYLNTIYFLDQQEIILELGADTRNSWSETIDTSQHLLLRTTWSLREEHPDIWQIPLQELLPILENSENKTLASHITTIIMENTLDCLGLDVLQKVFVFARTYNIRIIALKYRPLSAPSLQEVQNSPRTFHPNIECPSLLLAAQELLEIIRLRPSDLLIGIYIYRPPMGTPLILLYQFANTPEDFQQFKTIQEEVKESNGSVEFLLVPTELMGDPNIPNYLDIYRETIGQLLMMLLALLDRPQEGYRVHMTQNTSAAHLTLVQTWFLGLTSALERLDLNISMQLDTFGTTDTSVSKDMLLHTADGEFISPYTFIQEWSQRGFDESILQKYAFGLMGNIKNLPYNTQNNWLGEPSNLIFQATRIEISD